MQHRVLVTGAAGFAGAHLTARLGTRAVAFDADVTDAAAVAASVRGARADAVAHLAALSSVAASWQSRGEAWSVNVVGTVNVLDAVAAASPEARVLCVSSGEVYGDTGESPAAEAAPVVPVSPYAAAKAAAEVACDFARRRDGLDVVVARPFPHVGPGQDERFAVGSWVAQIARLEVSGGGALAVGALDAVRDLTDVRDVCRAYELLLDPSVPAGVYNVASGRAVPMSEVLGLLVSMARCPVEVTRDPERLRPADLRSLRGDAAKLREATGWQPEIPLEVSLADALDHARAAVTAEGAVA